MPRKPPTEHPMPIKGRGGRRPGAGAPRGNTNAVKAGRHSRRFYYPALIISICPALRRHFWRLQDLARPGFRPHARLLHAVRDAIETNPTLADDLAAFIQYNLQQRYWDVPRGASILDQLQQPIPHSRRLRRSLLVAAYLHVKDPVLSPLLADYLLYIVEPHMNKDPDTSIKQSNRPPQPTSANLETAQIAND